MSICKLCALNGRKREGGDLAVCPQHRKTKCVICGAASLGQEMCAAHAHQVETMRWTAQAEFRVIDSEDQIESLEIRHAKLKEAKFLAFQSIEIMFRALHGAVQAVWGKPGIAPEPDTIEEKKAA